MRNQLLLGIGAGLAGAVLFASATTGHPLARLVLFFLAPLPAFLAGLGWGWAAAMIAGLAGTLLVGVATTALGALVYGLTLGLPAAVLTYLVSLNRPDNQGNVEWYPIGRLVVWSALIGAALSVLWLLAVGGNLDDLRTALRTFVVDFLKQIPTSDPAGFDDEAVDALTEVALFAMPAASAVSWTATFLFNLWLAGRITRASGRLLRPWPDLSAMVFPSGTGIVLALSMLISLPDSWTGLPAYPRLMAAGFGGAFWFAYVLLGLAIAHAATRKAAAVRPFILFFAYAGLIVQTPWMSLLLVLIALLEPWSPWRRAPPQPGSPPGRPPANPPPD